MNPVFYTKKFILMYSNEDHQQVVTTMLASDLMEIRAHPGNPSNYTAVRHRGWGAWVIIGDNVDNVRRELYEITKSPQPTPGTGGSGIPPLPQGFEALTTPQDEIEAYAKREPLGSGGYPTLLMGKEKIPELPAALLQK